MKRYKTSTEGSVKGILNALDILEIQNKAIDAINVSDSVIKMHQGMNASLSNLGVDITPGIFLWGGTPATFLGKNSLNVNRELFYTVTVVSEDKRTIVEGVNKFDYYAYDYYQVEITSEFYSVGSRYNDKEVVCCVPFFMRSNDCDSCLTQDNSVTGDNNEVISYNNKKCILLKAGNNNYVLVSGVIIGDASLAADLGGYTVGNLVFFSDVVDPQNASLKLSSKSSVADIPLSGLLIEILSQVRKNLNDLKEVAYTSDYNDLENKLKEADSLLLNIDSLPQTSIELKQDTIRNIISAIVGSINSIKSVAFTGSYLDLDNAPKKLSDLTDDKGEVQEEVLGALKFISTQSTIPVGWKKADGTQGTLDATSIGNQIKGWEDLMFTDGNFTTSDGQILQTAVPALVPIQKVGSDKSSLKLVSSTDLGTVGTSPVGGNLNITLQRLTGSNVSIYAVPKGSNRFIAWNIGTDSQSTDNPLVINLNSDKQYTATFERMYKNTLICVSDYDGAAVSIKGKSFQKSEVFYTKPGFGMDIYAKEPTDASFVFKGFYVNGELFESTYNSENKYWEILDFNIGEDCVIKAVYAKKPFITIDINPNGSGSYSLDKSQFNIGDIVLITATPSTLNRFSDFTWSVDGAERSSSENPLPYEVLEGENNINVSFQQVYKTEVQTENKDSVKGLISVDELELSNFSEIVSDRNSVLVLSAEPNTGYKFIQWNSQNSSPLSYKSKFSYLVEDNNSVWAVFSRIYSLLSINVSPLYSGEVSGDGTYEYGSSATLNAVPITGYVFKQWEKMLSTGQTEVLSTDAQHSVDMNEELEIKAVFEKITYNVNVTSSDVSGGSASGTGNYGYGDIAVVNANPALYYNFSGWYENDVLVSSSLKYSFTVQRSWNLRAVFRRETRKLILVKSPSSGGVTVGAGTIDMGSYVNLQATSNPGYFFSGWYEGIVELSKQSSFSLLLLRDMNIIAKFSVINLQIEAIANNDLYGVANGSGTFSYGDSVTVIAVPRSGYEFSKWVIKESGETVSTLRVYQFTALASLNLQAVFVAVQFTINANSDNLNKGTVTGGGTYAYNTMVSLRANPSSGFSFDGWYEGVIKISELAVYSFNVTGNRNLIAKFK